MQIRPQPVRHGLLPLILVAGERALIIGQVREKSEPSDAIGGDSLAVNDDGTVEELAQVIPVKLPAILEFLQHARGVESVLRLPELQHQEAADERLIEWPRCEHPKIVDVARFVPLITRADFLGKDFGEREAGDIGRRDKEGT